MKDWYLTTPTPNVTSGYEDDEISEYAQGNFTDVLFTGFSDSLILYNSDMTESTTIRGIVQNTVSNTKENSNKRTILLPIGTCKIGMYIKYDDAYWLICNIPDNNKSYEKAIVYYCNWTLKWQNTSGVIISRPSVINDSSSLGINSDKTIILGSDELSVNIPVDSESLKLKKTQEKKFFIDNNTETPTVYKLTSTGNVTNTYNGHGITNWVMQETTYNITEDDLKYGVCGYVAPTTPVDPVTPNQTTILSHISYKKLSVISGGSSQTYTASFTQNGQAVTTTAVWTVTCDFKSKLNISYGINTITIGIDNDDYIGKTIQLSVTNTDGTAQLESVILTIESLY